MGDRRDVAVVAAAMASTGTYVAAKAQGTITPFESGYARSVLHKTGGTWKITKHTIVHDLPFVTPGN